MKKYVARTNWEITFPKYKAVKIDKDGYGQEIAWFWEEKDLKEYLDFLNKKDK